MNKDSLGFIMVCHIGGKVGTKVVILVLRMLALYMCFNGTGISGGETIIISWNMYVACINRPTL